MMFRLARICANRMIGAVIIMPIALIIIGFGAVKIINRFSKH